MSIGMNIALIVALALAATGISTQQQAGVTNSSTGGRGQNLNHNETLVRETKLKTIDPLTRPKCTMRSTQLCLKSRLR